VVIDPKGPFDKVRYGSIVELSNGKRLRIGSYSGFAEHPIHTVSYNSPVELALIGKAEGNGVELFGQKLTIVKIT
jgi:transcription elongation GreA/GreB family factor